MLLPLLSTQKTVPMKDAAGNTVNGVVDNATRSRVLPMLLFSSAGSAQAAHQAPAACSAATTTP